MTVPAVSVRGLSKRYTIPANGARRMTAAELATPAGEVIRGYDQSERAFGAKRHRLHRVSLRLANGRRNCCAAERIARTWRNSAAMRASRDDEGRPPRTALALC